MFELGGILLAAGASKRFGASKLLHPLNDGTPIGLAAACNLIDVVPNSVAVVRPEEQRLADMLSEVRLRIVENPVANQGMSTSISAGIRALPQCSGWLIALADMPWVRPATIRALTDSLVNGASIVAPSYEGQRGNPVGFSSRWKHSLQNLSGDEGARKLITKYSGELILLDTPDRGVLEDIDHPDDL
jgi:molybdenum cofactor cytidylyltransferase